MHSSEKKAMTTREAAPEIHITTSNWAFPGFSLQSCWLLAQKTCSTQANASVRWRPIPNSRVVTCWQKGPAGAQWARIPSAGIHGRVRGFGFRPQRFPRPTSSYCLRKRTQACMSLLISPTPTCSSGCSHISICGHCDRHEEAGGVLSDL